MTAAPDTTPAAWRVVLACFLCAVFAWGFSFYAHGIYLVELQKARGWSTGLISSIVTGHYVLGALLLPAIARAIGRFGPRAVLLSGLVVLAGALGATIVQRHPTGLVRIVGTDGVYRWSGMGWRFEPLVDQWIDQVADGDGDHHVLHRLLEFAVHDLGARGIGAILVYRPDESLTLSHELRLQTPPKLRITWPMALAPLRHALAQTDGAALFDDEGVLMEIGVRLVPTFEAEVGVEGYRGMRHTAARRYSYDDPGATVIVVSEDGPVTVFRGGQLTGTAEVGIDEQAAPS